MAKRFTDTQIWEKEWFMKLLPKQKCLWRYITERCDQAGVWEPNWSLASIYIGETVNGHDLLFLGDHIEILKNGKIFIPDFIDFQYGRLSKKSPAHNPVFRAIEKNSLLDRVFNRVSNTPLDMEVEEEEEKEVEEEEEIVKKESPNFSTPDVSNSDLVYPLTTDGFMAAWSKWKEYRFKAHAKDYRKMYAEQAALDQLKGLTEEQIIAAINQAMASNWFNLYPFSAGRPAINGKPIKKPKAFEL